MKIDLDLYEQVRTMAQAGHSAREIARELHISRNTVRKFITGAVDLAGDARPRIRQATVITEQNLQLIRGYLEEDQLHRSSKQRHTALRCFERLREEQGYTGSYASVTAMVRQVKGSMRPVFVPQTYAPGVKLQVDFGEMDIFLRGELTRIYLFCARLCYSCRPLVLAYRRQNQDSFLDGRCRVFMELGGVPQEVIFDNARVAVASGSGARAALQRRYELLRVHYGFTPVFCNPRQGHEKGLVENLVRWIRNQVGSPRPRVDSIRAFDALLAERCASYEERQLRGRPGTVGERYAADRAALQPLPQQPCDPARSLTAAVSAFSTVRFDTNQYSVPAEVIRRSGVREVALRVYPEFIRIVCHGEVIAEHERLYGRHQALYCLRHYLPLLAERPRAMLHAAPVVASLRAAQHRQLQLGQHSDREIYAALAAYAEKQAGTAAIGPVPTAPAAGQDPAGQEQRGTGLYLYDTLY